MPISNLSKMLLILFSSLSGGCAGGWSERRDPPALQ